MNLTDLLKEVFYRRQFGSEQADLIARVERAMAELPQTEGTERWSEWVWSLPPEAWEEAVSLRLANRELVDQREEGVRLIAQKNRLQSHDPCSVEALAATEALTGSRPASSN